MSGYILVDVKTKKILAMTSMISLCLFILGILIGYFSGKSHRSSTTSHNPNNDDADAIRSACSMTTLHTLEGQRYFQRYMERHTYKHACVNTAEECLDFGLPRYYNAYHLRDQNIVIDGRLDDKAWLEVPWSEPFVDMRSEVYPQPFLDTKFKMRWDNERLYIGAYIQEKDLWATMKEHDSEVWKENGLEVLLGVDGTMYNYKQAQVNVLGTMKDQLLFKSYYDGPDPLDDKNWHPDAKREVYVEGTVNKPGDEDRYWTVEMSFSFKSLAAESLRNQIEPMENEVWFVQFGRSEQKLIVNKNGYYEQEPNSTINWWSWQPCGTIDLHIQDRWGLVQFKTNKDDEDFIFHNWHIYKALFDIFNALKIYEALNDKYVTSVEELDVPPYLLSRACVDTPEIRLVNTGNGTGFIATIRSLLYSHKPAHISDDRYVWFE